MTHKHKNVTMKCPRCGNLFVLGVNGAGVNSAYSPIALCDKCASVERRPDGTAKYKWENK